ncbi:MAG: hypothetical protein V4690_03595 [Patescibacteria group bacterium]
MSEYFDRDFFKFLLGFTFIVCVSLAIILVGQVHKNKGSLAETTPTCETSTC